MYTHIQMHLMHIFILRNAFRNDRLQMKLVKALRAQRHPINSIQKKDYFLEVYHAENAIKKNINLLLESISLDDDKSLVSACIVLFIIAFFQEGNVY